MNLGNFDTLHRILRSPAAHVDDGGMGQALEALAKRGVKLELEEPTPAEKAAGEAKSRKETKVEEWSDPDGDQADQAGLGTKGAAAGEEEDELEKEEDTAAAAKKAASEKAAKDKAQAEKEAADGTTEGPSAAEIAEATSEWKAKIVELEGAINAESDAGKKAKLEEELTAATEALESWEQAGQPSPNVETVDTVKAELTKAQTEKAALETRVRELEAKGEPGLSVENVNPLFFAEKPELIDELDRTYAEFERWAVENADGIEEKTDDAGKVVQKGFTAKQIRSRLWEISELRKNLIPRARQAVAAQAQAREQARTVYPEIFDAKRPEAKAAENILRAAPVLKAIFPNVWVIIGDALVGERLRLSKAAGAARGAGSNGAKRPLPRVARAGGGGAGLSGSAAAGLKRVQKQKQVRASGGVDVEKFMEGGGDRNALVAAIS